MSRALVIALALLGASCSSSRTIDFATLGNLSYAVPTGWSSQPIADQRITMVQWTPDDNDAKESMMIMRTSPRAALAKAGPPYLVRLLAEAQTGLAKGSFSKPSSVRTQHGFVGARLEGTFVPTGQSQPYHRIHAVVVDGDSLVHVMYTAKVPDPEAFEIVLDSLTRKAG